MGANTATLIMANWTIFRVRLCGVNIPESPQGGHFLDQVYDPEAITYLQGFLRGQVGRSTYSCSMGTT